VAQTGDELATQFPIRTSVDSRIDGLMRDPLGRIIRVIG